MTTKTCPRCQQTKSLSEYYGAKRSYCIECERETARERMRKHNATFQGRAKLALRDSKRAAAKYGVFDDLTLDDVLYTFRIAEGCCNYCGEYFGDDLQLEHIFSLSTGGHNTLANITTACAACNLKKRDEAIMTHIQTNPFDIELLNALIDRIAYRMGVDRGEVAELLELQQRDCRERKYKGKGVS
ncbi:5-methylcytosine-specific restriction endonuclease McrA/uncharacterized protein YheU (UPF0270 family) [Lederbergia galactosidilyticus]|nr:5-methylcytosine-specific restriction endonuclease McrA/uncharacterized protein YheU (UPF0270 family) [Lederbergia galactosidilytica]